MPLYDQINSLRKYRPEAISPVPSYVLENLNPNFELRPYQQEAFENFITHFESLQCQRPTQLLFHMATGSGKTLIMAGLMLYLYKQGYRNFLFFVHLTNIVRKTIENFMSASSSKYLFAPEIVIDGKHVSVNKVDNFQYSDPNAINICFVATQKLHSGIKNPRENGIALDDFSNQKTVLISDEAHHLNADLYVDNEDGFDYYSWGEMVNDIFKQNNENVLLEFSATFNSNDPHIVSEYKDKIICDYSLSSYYSDKYSKDIVTLRSNLDQYDRALQALVLSQYRYKLFQKHHIAVKPVILFKSKTVPANNDFFDAFINNLGRLTGAKLQELANITQNSDEMKRAFAYFVNNDISMDSLAQELRDDFSKDHCISVNQPGDVEKIQVLLNSLEDEDNPYRAIFEVKKLDEGWDVLNLFDIVKLYDTKDSKDTVLDAQLIGRGARYFPFKIESNQSKYQRKYDADLSNEMRVCETLYYHCLNIPRYITQLHQALRDIGIDLGKIVKREYKLKDNFKNDDIYRYGFVFSNSPIEDEPTAVNGIPQEIRGRTYSYTIGRLAFATDEIMREVPIMHERNNEMHHVRMSIKEIASVNYSIVYTALRKYPELRFDILKSKFSSLKSTEEFITSNDYLGAINIDIYSPDERPTNETLYLAVYYVLYQIVGSIPKVEKTYHGSDQFVAKYINKVFRDMVVNNYSDPDGEGIGISQRNENVRDEWRIDLEREDWYAYTDNFGTTEEKAFVAYFKNYVTRLKAHYDKVYLVRNKLDLELYSFDEGKKFKPDFVLFLQKNNKQGCEQLRIFIEPKGTHLLAEDAWKEQFLLQLQGRAVPIKIYVDDNDYKIWGLHFYNQERRMADFNADFEEIFEEDAD